MDLHVIRKLSESYSISSYNLLFLVIIALIFKHQLKNRPYCQLKDTTKIDFSELLKSQWLRIATADRRETARFGIVKRYVQNLPFLLKPNIIQIGWFFCSRLTLQWLQAALHLALRIFQAATGVQLGIDGVEVGRPELLGLG